jgi:lipopolysaccharide exporter
VSQVLSQVLALDAAVPRASARRVRAGALWSGGSNLVMRVLGIAVTAVVVRFVTPDEFGVFAAALAVHAVASSVCELGATSCIGRRDLNPDRVGPTVASTALISAASAAALMFFCAGPLASVLGSPEADEPIRVLSLTLLLVGIFAVPSALLAREFRQRELFISTVVGFVPANAVLLVMASNGSGAMAFAWSRVVGHLAAGCVVALAARRYYRPGFDRASARLLVRFGLPLAAANLVNYVLLNADYAFISRLLGPAQLGVYMLAFNVASWSTAVLGSMINGVAMPAFSDVSRDRSGLTIALQRTVVMVSLVAFPIAGLTSALSQPLVAVLFGDTWSAAAPVLSVLALYGGLFTMSLVLSNALVALGRSMLLLGVQLLWITCLVPLVVVGVAWWGTSGAAVAHVVTIGLAVLPLYALSLSRSAGVSPVHLLRGAGVPAGAAAVAGFAAWMTSTSLPWSDLPQLVVSGLAGAAVYSAVVLPLVARTFPGTVARARRAASSAVSRRHQRAC